MLKHLLIPCILIPVTLSCSQSQQTETESSADNSSKATVYYNGDIITMEGDIPEYVEALVVKDGKIAFAGSSVEAMNEAGAGHEMVNLKGKDPPTRFYRRTRPFVECRLSGRISKPPSSS